ncbi:hypothetical protein Tco_1246781 [Tanacetum coccineum]
MILVYHFTSIFAMSNQQDIYATGSENRPPMLNKDNYVPWSSRLLRYGKSKPNGKLIYNSIMHGLCVRRMIPEPGDPDREVPVVETFHEQTDEELTEKEVKQIEADDQAIRLFSWFFLKTSMLLLIVVKLLRKSNYNLGVQNVGNQNGLIVILGIANQNVNQNGNGNVVAIRAKASTLGTQTDKAPVYDSDGSAKNDNNVISAVFSVEQSGWTVEQNPATVEETRAYFESLYNNLAIEVEKVNSVNRKMKETNVDLTTKFARYKNQEKCFEINQEKYDKLERCYQKSVYQEQCLTKKINALYLSYAKMIMTLNEEIENLNNQLSNEKSTVSFLQEENKKLKIDFKTCEDALLDKQIQLENKIKELDNILLKIDYQLADLFTKALLVDRFNYLICCLGMRSLSPQELERLAKSQEHGRMILESVEHGPLICPTIKEIGVTMIKKYEELSAIEKIKADCDLKATNIILQGLPSDVYSLINHYRVANDLWERVQLLMQGTSLTKQEKGVNTKFLNSLPPEWSKFVTDVKLVRDLHTTNFDQLHAYLEQHELHANEVCIMRERNQDPLALVANHQMTPSHFNTYQSSYNNPQFQQQFSPSQSPQYGSIHPTQHYSTTYPSTPLAIPYLSAPYPNAYSSTVHQDACTQP